MMSEFTEAELSANLENLQWRLENLYKIIVKGDDEDDDSPGLVMDFKPNRFQQRFLRRMWNRNIILKARQLGFCVDPSTRVLTADLRWVRIDTLHPGDEVVAVDEDHAGGKGSSRKMRTATVQANAVVHRMAYRIKFDDGREVVCTDRHPWLAKARNDKATAGWRSLSGDGNKVTGKLKVGYQVRWITKPWDDATAEDGWMGGMLDGEGSIAKPNASPGINVSQRHGPVWDRLVKYASDRGYHACIENDSAQRPSKHGKTPVPKLAFGRMDEMFRLIGQTRPTRFVGNRFWEGRWLPGRRNGDVGWSTITEIEELGMQGMVDLQTSTGTYIAEGFVSHNTTLIAILWLDTALFSTSPIRCGIIAQDKDAAEKIFRDKVKFAYDSLPEVLRERFPLKKATMSELEFEHNGAAIRVATSMRSGTIHRLHISEFGKICAKFPEKAKEIITGSLPAVPKSGITVIESTAEGNDGPFYSMTMRALAQQEQGAPLSVRDYRLHFYPWFGADEYAMDPAGIVITDADHEYFNAIEALPGGVTITPPQRAWYVATREADYNGDRVLMGQEYPSTPKEAFQVSIEGCYYSRQMADARRQGRVLLHIPKAPVPVNTFWDLGRGDMTAIWLHQRVGMENRFIRYYENSGEDLEHYAKYLLGLGVVFGVHFLPHDADYKRLGINPDSNQSHKEMLEDLMPGHTFEIVPRITRLQQGIEATRLAFPSCWFDETECAVGLQRLSNYRKKWNKVTGAWSNEPMHDDNSHGADGFRQFGQVVAAGVAFVTGSVSGIVNGPARQSSVRDALRARRARASGMTS